MSKDNNFTNVPTSPDAIDWIYLSDFSFFVYILYVKL